MSDNKKSNKTQKGFGNQLLSGWGYFQGYTSIFVYILGAILCFIFGVFTIKAARNNKFKIVRVTVTAINGTPKRTPRTRKCGSRYCAYDEYETDFSVEYTIDGTSYQQNLTKTTEDRPVQIGNTFQYEYNPENPSELREFSLMRNELVGIILIIIGIILCLFALGTYYCVNHDNCRMLLGFIGAPGTRHIY
tara:strand:- start:798 stop:1370 length:573 start_codon:yes stop_codon:yes gene_type:complete